MHGISCGTDKSAMVQAMHASLINGENAVFHGIRLDTCANRAFVMAEKQYDAF